VTTPDLYGRTPITDDDETIARLLDDVSVPTLLCAMVHITGDPSWIRDEEIKPQGLFLNIYDGFMSPEAQAEARARALPHILAFRDSGGELPPATVSRAGAGDDGLHRLRRDPRRHRADDAQRVEPRRRGSAVA
jgi:hypothetical protein